MEFLVAFALDIPAGTPKSEISDREHAEAAATAKLADEGHLVRVWRSGESTIVGLYRAESETQLDSLLRPLPLADWLHVTVTPLEAHPNDPAARQPARSNQLPEPRLSLTYRLDASLAPPFDLGDTARGHRRIGRYRRRADRRVPCHRLWGSGRSARCLRRAIPTTSP